MPEPQRSLRNETTPVLRAGGTALDNGPRRMGRLTPSFATGRIRLSTDIRYQNVRDEIDARWANHWSLDDML